MKIKFILLKLVKAIQYAYLLRKPSLVYLKYVDVVVENKQYLLLSWQFRRAYKITLKGARYSSYKRGGSAIVNFPSNTTAISLVISNTWKKISFTLPLKQVELDREIEFNLKARFETIDTSNFSSKSLLIKEGLSQEISNFKTKALHIRPNKITPHLQQHAFNFNQNQGL